MDDRPATMPMELHAFLWQSALPRRDRWQAAMDRLGLPVTFDPAEEPADVAGFCPMTLDGRDAGVEIMVHPAAELIPDLRNMLPEAAGSMHVVSFRWVGDMGEWACALAAAAGLMEGFGAKVFQPEDLSWVPDASNLVGAVRVILAGL